MHDCPSPDAGGLDADRTGRWSHRTARSRVNGARTFRQMVRFGIVGVINTATCLAILWTLHDVVGWPVWLGSVAGYAVAIVMSYQLNRNWTFAGMASVPVGPQVARFVGVNAMMGLVFAGLTSLLAPALGVQAGSVAALVPVTLLSFLAQRRLVFGATR